MVILVKTEHTQSQQIGLLCANQPSSYPVSYYLHQSYAMSQLSYLHKSSLPHIRQPGSFAAAVSIARRRHFRVDGDILGEMRQFVMRAWHSDFVADNRDSE